jgi:two-component system, chemotaxis family, chemotaxis protein CheY
MSLNVLVVDDSAVMRNMVIRVLRLTGLPLGEVYQASNGQEGLESLKSNWIDLALVDINMPVMNGEQMIDHVRQDPHIAETPIVVISTETSQARIELLQRKGVEFVHKPFSAETLRATIFRMTGMADEQADGSGASPDRGADF